MNWLFGLIGVPFLFAIIKKLLWTIVFKFFAKTIRKNKGVWFIYFSSFITGVSLFFNNWNKIFIYIIKLQLFKYSFADLFFQHNIAFNIQVIL